MFGKTKSQMEKVIQEQESEIKRLSDILSPQACPQPPSAQHAALSLQALQNAYSQQYTQTSGLLSHLGGLLGVTGTGARLAQQVYPNSTGSITITGAQWTTSNVTPNYIHLSAVMPVQEIPYMVGRKRGTVGDDKELVSLEDFVEDVIRPFMESGHHIKITCENIQERVKAEESITPLLSDEERQHVDFVIKTE